MHNFLFVSNIIKKIGSFSIPSIKAAQSLGYKVHIAANFSEFDDESQKYNITTHHLDLDRIPFKFTNIRAFYQMMKIISKEEIEVIHCNTPVGGILGRLCGRISKVPTIIYTVHGFHFYQGGPFVKNIIFKLAESWLSRFTDIIITINKEDFLRAKEFKLRNNGKVYHIPGVGIDTNIYMGSKSIRKQIIDELGINDDSVILLSLGELNANKNNKMIIEALAEIGNKNIHYLMCGIGEEEENLRDLTEKCSLKRNIHFLGYRNDVPELLKSVDIFVMPSFREGLSRALMEAMCSGLPCIVSRIRGNIDLIEDGVGGFLHKPDNLQGFKKSIMLLADNNHLRKSMGDRNILDIKKYDINNINRLIQNIYINHIMID